MQNLTIDYARYEERYQNVVTIYASELDAKLYTDKECTQLVPGQLAWDLFLRGAVIYYNGIYYKPLNCMVDGIVTMYVLVNGVECGFSSDDIVEVKGVFEDDIFVADLNTYVENNIAYIGRY